MFQDVSSVTGLTVGTDGTVYAVERYHHSVYKVPPGGAATLVSGIGLSGYLDDTIPHAMFNERFDITADALGNLFIADRSNTGYADQSGWLSDHLCRQRHSTDI